MYLLKNPKLVLSEVEWIRSKKISTGRLKVKKIRITKIQMPKACDKISLKPPIR